MSTMTSSLIVRLIDQVTGPAKGVEQSLRGINRAGGATGAAPSFADNMAQAQARVGTAIEANNRAMDAARGRMVDAVAGYYLLDRTIGRTVRVAAGFEEAMINVGVISRANEDQLADLSQQAKELGRTTMFTASEVADGMGFLAMAGFNVDQVMGSMENTLNLAAAGNMELGRSADIVSNILTGYGKDVEDLEKISDILVGTFTRSNTSLDQLGSAFTYAGPIAAAAGMDFAETAAVLGRLGDAGYQGTLGGTALRGAIVRLLAPTKGAAAAMDELDVSLSDIIEDGEDLDTEMAGVAEAMKQIGLTVTDSEGRMLAFADIMQQLEGHADDVGLMASLFGQRAGPAMAALLSQGSDSVRELTDELDALDGEAKRVADARMEGFTGQMRAFRSAVEGAQIAIGNALLPALTELISTFTRLIGPVTEFLEANPKLTAAIVGAAAAMIGLKVAAAGLTFIGLLGKGGALSLLAGGLRAITFLGTPVAGFFETLRMRNALAARSLGRTPSVLERIGDATRVLIRRVPGVGLASKALGGVGVALAGITAPVWMGIAAGALALGAAGIWLHKNWEKVSAFLSGFGRRIKEEFAPALEWVGEKWGQLKEALGLDAVFEAIGASLTGAREKISDFFEWIKSFFKREVLSDEDKAAWGDAGEGAADMLINGVKMVFTKFIPWVMGGWASDLFQAVAGISIYEAGQKMVDTLKQAFFDFLDWLRELPGRILSAIGNIDLSSIINWPSPPAWFTNRPSWMGGSGGTGNDVSGHRARGGPVWPGGSFLVGDGGEEEVFTPNTGGQITPLSAIERRADELMQGIGASASTSSRAAGPVNVSIGDIIIKGASDPAETARQVRDMLSREIEAALRGVNADMGVRS